MVPLMKSPCEEFMKKFSTQIRLALALELINNYNKTQFEAARLLNIPQPLINYVITGRRRAPGIDKLRSCEETIKVIEDVAKRLANGEEVSMCSICSRIRNIICEAIS